MAICVFGRFESTLQRSSGRKTLKGLDLSWELPSYNKAYIWRDIPSNPLAYQIETMLRAASASVAWISIW